jgi:hypothetical protein
LREVENAGPLAQIDPDRDLAKAPRLQRNPVNPGRSHGVLKIDFTETPYRRE